MTIHPDESGLSSMFDAAISTTTRLGYRLSYRGQPNVSNINRDYGGAPVVRKYGPKHSHMLTFEKPGSLVQISLCAGRKIWNRHTLEQYEPEHASVGVYTQRPHPRPWPEERTTVDECADIERFIRAQLEGAIV
jgi:hypothetical protein